LATTNEFLPRTWTSIDGQTISASFVAVDNDQLVIKATDERIIRVRLDQLCQDDRIVAHRLATPKLAGHGLRRTQTPTTLTEEQIAGLRKQLNFPDKGKEIRLYVSFKRRKLHWGEKPKYVNSGKMPIRLTTSLYEYRGRKKRRLKGICRFYILNSDGDVIISKTTTLDRLRPNDGEGGYYTELPKAGRYTLVIWTEQRDVMFGRQMDVRLPEIR
jgi:hypothetical protein